MAVGLPKYRPPTHPGEMLLEEFLKPLEISQAEFARRIGVPFQRVNAVINGRRGMTPDTAARVARFFNTSVDVWLGLQQGWDLWHALREAESTNLDAVEPLREHAAA